MEEYKLNDNPNSVWKFSIEKYDNDNLITHYEYNKAGSWKRIINELNRLSKEKQQLKKELASLQKH